MHTGTNTLLVRLKTNSRDFDATAGNTIAVAELDPIQIVENNKEAENPWDAAHDAKSEDDYSFAEPEIESSALQFRYQEDLNDRGSLSKEEYFRFMDYWSSPALPSIWHLDQEHSQLKMARDAVKAKTPANTVRIAHLDTGYSKDHISFPGLVIRHDLERNFVEGEEDRWNNAQDQFNDGTLKMPGHGTGTLSILAGAQVDIPSYGFNDFLGLSHSIEVVPIRIARSVVLFKSGAFVRALNYIINELGRNEATRIHVVSMSMGGLPSNAWADVVNLAYEKGIFIVTAAGNNFKKLPTRTMVFPARFKRVVAACGVAYDLSPYAKPNGEGKKHIMEGNYGPQALMGTAIAAFTPNVCWATYRFNDVVGIRGDGTSSATPQVASAAALYYSMHYDELEALPEPWMRVEAIRKAMFDSAKKYINTDNDRYENDYARYYGNGILQAMNMLEQKVAKPEELQPQDKDKVNFPFFKMILGLKGMEDDITPEEDMLETELMQLILSDDRLQQLLDNEEKTLETLSREEKIQLADIVIQNEHASSKLKQQMQLLKNQQSL